jgi:hypothetical protein
MFAEDPSRQSHCAERAQKLERLSQRNADFLDGNVIKNVRHGDTGYGRNHENEIYEPAYLNRGRDISKSTGEWEKQDRGNKTNETKATNRTEPGGGTLYQDAVKRPTSGGDEGNQQSAKSDVPGIGPRLKPKDPNCAEQSEQGADLELPLPKDVALFRKENERKQSSHDHGRTGEDGVNAWTDVKKGDRLSDLMDDVWDGRDQAENERAKIEPRSASSPNTKSDEGGDRDTGNAVAVKILRPNIVVAQQIKLEK